MIRIGLFVLSLALLVSPAYSKQITTFRSGSWTGAAYADDRTGKFRSCTAIASYKSGIAMIVLVSRAYRWELGFDSNRWDLKKGSKINLSYRIDRGRWRSVTGQVYSSRAVRLPMPPRGPLVRQFRRGKVLQLSDGQKSYYFNLTGTSRLMVDLVRCVDKFLAAEKRGQSSERVVRNNTLTPRREPKINDTAQTARREPSPRVTKPSNNTANAAVLHSEGTRVLYNFLSSAGLNGGKILAPDEFPRSLKDAHAVATVGNHIGFAMVVPKAAANAKHRVTGTIISNVAKNCSGQFASGSSNEQVGGTSIAAGFTACKKTSDTSYLRYYVTPRNDGGLYLFGVMSALSPGALDSADGAEADGGVNNDQLRDAAYQASR